MQARVRSRRETASAYDVAQPDPVVRVPVDIPQQRWLFIEIIDDNVDLAIVEDVSVRQPGVYTQLRQTYDLAT